MDIKECIARRLKITEQILAGVPEDAVIREMCEFNRDVLVEIHEASLRSDSQGAWANRLAGIALGKEDD